MAGNGKVLVRLHHGWEGDTLVSYDGPSINTHPLSADASIFEFEVPDKYEWVHSTAIKDGWSFDVSCEYSNSTGSRTEKTSLVPQKL